jgi:hypothetical protein
MEYSQAHCRACNSWQTVIVGYSGERICVACGEIVQRGRRGGALAPVAGGTLVDLAWAHVQSPTHEQRRERLRQWLANQSLTLPDDHLSVLAHCESASEVRFALPIVLLDSWRPVGERSFSDGAYTLRVQPAVAGQAVDFLLEGPGDSRPTVIEIESPAPPDPERARAATLRALHLQAEGYAVMRVPAREAAERGKNFRRIFLREALRVIESTPEPAVRLATGTGVMKPKRVWSRHELVYDATGSPWEEKRELVEDWLRSREEILEPWQLDFLAHCDRAAEVLFALPLLRLPGAEPLDSGTVHLDAWHTLLAQVAHGGYRFAFVVTALLEGAEEVSTTFVDIRPARGRVDLVEERARRRAWEAEGIEVTQIGAAEAREQGRRLAASLSREREWRSAHDAG